MRSWNMNQGSGFDLIVKKYILKTDNYFSQFKNSFMIIIIKNLYRYSEATNNPGF